MEKSLMIYSKIERLWSTLHLSFPSLCCNIHKLSLGKGGAPGLKNHVLLDRICQKHIFFFPREGWKVTWQAAKIFSLQSQDFQVWVPVGWRGWSASSTLTCECCVGGFCWVGGRRCRVCGSQAKLPIVVTLTTWIRIPRGGPRHWDFLKRFLISRIWIWNHCSNVVVNSKAYYETLRWNEYFYLYRSWEKYWIPSGRSI